MSLEAWKTEFPDHSILIQDCSVIVSTPTTHYSLYKLLVSTSTSRSSPSHQQQILDCQAPSLFPFLDLQASNLKLVSPSKMPPRLLSTVSLLMAGPPNPDIAGQENTGNKNNMKKHVGGTGSKQYDLNLFDSKKYKDQNEQVRIYLNKPNSYNYLFSQQPIPKPVAVVRHLDEEFQRHLAQYFRINRMFLDAVRLSLAEQVTPPKLPVSNDRYTLSGSEIAMPAPLFSSTPTKKMTGTDMSNSGRSRATDCTDVTEGTTSATSWPEKRFDTEHRDKMVQKLMDSLICIYSNVGRLLPGGMANRMLYNFDCQMFEAILDYLSYIQKYQKANELNVIMITTPLDPAND
jgi:hypothetical protein